MSFFGKKIVDAAIHEGGRNLGNKLMIGAGGVLLGTAAVKAGKDTIVDPAIQAYNINKSRSRLTTVNPMLKQEDPKLVKSYFNVVKQFSPKAASNPLVAGALVNKMIQFGGVDHKLVQDLAKINKDTTVKNEATAMLASAAAGAL